MKVAKPDLRAIAASQGLGVNDLEMAHIQMDIEFDNASIVAQLERGESTVRLITEEDGLFTLDARVFQLVEATSVEQVMGKAAAVGKLPEPPTEARPVEAGRSDDTCLTDCRTHHVGGLGGLGRVDKDVHGVRYFKTPTGGAKVIHPEHQEVELPPDTELCADRCREWDPFANDGMGEIRKLYD